MHTHDGRVWVVVGTLGTDLWVDVYRVWVVVRYTGYRSMGGCIQGVGGC